MKRLDTFKHGNLAKLGYSQYNISTDGTIVNVATNTTLKPFIDRRGYENYSLWGDDGSRKTFRCHQLVARMFLDNPNHYPQVDHLDCNKRNNSVSNLEWVSNDENQSRARRNGLYAPANTYPEDLIHEICKLLEAGYNIYEVSDILGAPQDLIFCVYHRITWKSISWGYNF